MEVLRYKNMQLVHNARFTVWENELLRDGKKIPEFRPSQPGNARSKETLGKLLFHPEGIRR